MSNYSFELADFDIKNTADNVASVRCLDEKEQKLHRNKK